MSVCVGIFCLFFQSADIMLVASFSIKNTVPIALSTRNIDVKSRKFYQKNVLDSFQVCLYTKIPSKVYFFSKYRFLSCAQNSKLASRKLIRKTRNIYKIFYECWWCKLGVWLKLYLPYNGTFNIIGCSAESTKFDLLFALKLLIMSLGNL